MYLMFLNEFRIRPEELREMPIYDVYMIQYARTASYINDLVSKRPKPMGKAQADRFFGG